MKILLNICCILLTHAKWMKFTSTFVKTLTEIWQ
jgi:hypothetical protein